MSQLTGLLEILDLGVDGSLKESAWWVSREWLPVRRDDMLDTRPSYLQRILVP